MIVYRYKSKWHKFRVFNGKSIIQASNTEYPVSYYAATQNQLNAENIFTQGLSQEIYP